MITKTSRSICIWLLLLSISFGGIKRYWDLGVIIDKKENIIIQQEIDISTITSSQEININQDHIKALHTNNFISPILHDLKYSQFENHNIIKKYDDIIFTLSFSEKLNFIKRSFLKNQYHTFSSLYNLIEKTKTTETEHINSMYIQNLYRSNQFDAAINILDIISVDAMTDDLLLYKIKTNIKLTNFKKSQEDIDLFKNKFKDSDLLRYVEYEQKLLDNKYEN